MHQTIGNIIYSGFRGFNLSLFVSLLSSPFFGYISFVCVCVFLILLPSVASILMCRFSLFLVFFYLHFSHSFHLFASLSLFSFSFTMAFDQTYIHSGLQHIHLCAFQECELNLFAKLFHTFKNYYIKFHRI